MKNTYNCRGFSFSELAVVLAIISFIAGSAISVAVTNDSSIKSLETENKLDSIEESIVGFLAANLRLPCPADGTLAINNVNFGFEAIDGASGSPDPAVCTANLSNSDDVWFGVVPVKTLQLPNDYMFDGWGRRIGYAVKLSRANNEVTNADCGTASTECFIDAVQNSDMTVALNNGSFVIDVDVVLISFGENGHGAYPKNGGNRVNGFPPGNPYRDDAVDEFSNADFNSSGVDTGFDGDFVLRNQARVDDQSASVRDYFDDIVRFKSKDLLVREAGATMYDTVCRDAQDIVNNPSDNACTGGAGEENCDNFATRIIELCL